MRNRTIDDRGIKWPALRNARDLGGLPLIGGGWTKTGAVIRSDTPARLTSIGLERALDHPVRTVIDLREARPAAAQPNPLREQRSVTYHHLPLLPDDFPLPVIRGGYPQALDAAQPQMASVFRAILGDEAPTLVHCHSGVGRTGLFTIVLLDLIGVPADAIVEDFRAGLTEAHDEEHRAPIEVLAHLHERHGGGHAYLTAAGLGANEIDTLHRLLRTDDAEVDSGLTADSQRWLEGLVPAGSLVQRPLTWRVAVTGDRPGRLLPLWLEPEIDYVTGVVTTARDPVGRLPSPGVRAHETVHWALALIGGQTSRCIGLEGICDTAVALLTQRPVVTVRAVPSLSRDLRRPAFDARADLSTAAHFGRLIAALEEAGVVADTVVAGLRQERAGAPGDDVQAHAFGVPFGAWLWRVLADWPTGDALRLLLAAASVRQVTPSDAVDAVLGALPAADRPDAKVEARRYGIEW